MNLVKPLEPTGAH